jgi:HTH-type transcriptional regulator, transcriptional repressor of NAD biosynthesis genes
LNIVHVTEEAPQFPHEHIDFWKIWVNIARKYTSSDLDCIFTSENYGDEYANKLGIEHVLVDIDRKTIPISGTLVRTDPYKYWNYIPEIVKPYFMKKVVLTGPESVGKTTTSRILAEHFKTLWVPEYGREYTERKPQLELRDISHIAAGQLELEQIISTQAAQKSKLIICDTDLIVTQIWSEIFFNTCPQWIVEANELHKYDLFLLMNTDIPWVNDGTRAFGHIREWHFERLKKELDERNIKYVTISGNYEQRTERAIEAVEKLMVNVA